MGPSTEVREVQMFDRRHVAWLALALVVVATSPGIARAEDSSQTPTYESGGLGAAAALCSLLYGPAKATMAISGLIVGGLAYPLSCWDSDVSTKVIDPSAPGDY